VASARASDLARTAGVAAAVAALAGLLHLGGVWASLDEAIFDAFTVASVPRALPASPVVVVGIDEPSFSELRRRWPWPRAVHARLVDELARAGVAVIAFDVLFSEPSADPAEDAELARAIAAARNVVLAAELSAQNTAHFQGVQLVEPLAELRRAGAASGIATITIGGDQAIRRFPQDPDSFWRVVLERYRTARGEPAASALGEGAMVRYSDGSDVGYVSYYQALEAAKLLPPGALRGKVALVGLALKTSPDVRAADTYATPFLRFSRQFAPGVEIQAQFIAAAHSGRVIAPVASAWTWLLAAAALAASVALMRRWSALWAGAFTAAVLLAAAGGSLALFVSGWWLAVAPVMGVVLGMFVGRGATAYLDERRHRAEIRRAFEHYVAPAVVSEMTAHPERLVLGGQRRELTVMFTDLAGFTTMSEGMAPEAVGQILNEHLTRMTRIVLANGGTIDKFIGDAVMAFWGAPIDDPDHALHAVRAAIEMQAEMKRWRREPGGPAELYMRVGVNTGPVVVGNMGSKDRFAYSVIGDAVNLASRLESLNRVYGTPILLAEATAAAVGNAIALRHVDRVRVKGKTQAIEIYTPEADAGLVTRTGEAIAALSRARLGRRGRPGARSRPSARRRPHGRVSRAHRDPSPARRRRRLGWIVRPRPQVAPRAIG
jgi:adenylate cyclase